MDALTSTIYRVTMKNIAQLLENAWIILFSQQ